MKHEPLSLIPPQFEVPLPALQPAVFPPTLNEPPPPALELFDLDEQFASPKVRLAHLTNACTDEDIEYYVKEAGDILQVTAQLKPEARTTKHIIEHILKSVVNWKRVEQQPAAAL